MSVELGGPSEDLPVIVDVFEEVLLGLVRNKFVDIAFGVFFISKTIVRRFDYLGRCRCTGLLDSVNVEVSAIGLLVESVGVSITTCNSESS